MDRSLDVALVRLGHALGLQSVAQERRGVHSTLESIPLPAEEVIGVAAIASAILIAPSEWVSIRPPATGTYRLNPVVFHMVSRATCGMRMGCEDRASTGSNKSSLARVVHMILMVRRIEILCRPSSYYFDISIGRPGAAVQARAERGEGGGRIVRRRGATHAGKW